MVHVQLHAPWIPAGFVVDRAQLVGTRTRRPSESEVTGMTPPGPAVSAPLWEELFMGTGAALAVDPDVVTCTLAPRYDAVKTARDFTRTTLLRWGLENLFDDVALVSSELVTNALRHAIGQPTVADLAEACCPSSALAGFPVQAGNGRAPEGQGQAAEGRLPVRLSLVHRASQLVCAVSDPSTEGPVTREADFVAESGRGLHLVDSFSQSWGWHPLASGAGKVVWALFQADEPSAEVPGLAADAMSAMTASAGRHRRSA
ncbi:hypothetical protein ABH930_005890 [Kitasatospora sp. GAS204A]|nr:hypothetical protein [Kitasatospora sp. GAS204B]